MALALALRRIVMATLDPSEFEIVANLAPQDMNTVRGQTPARLAKGDISQINSGDWSLDIDLKQKKGSLINPSPASRRLDPLHQLPGSRRAGE